MTTTDRFDAYLLASLPSEYPISSIPLSLKMHDAHRKELVFQQNKFLAAARERITEQPWITYIAAEKHLALLQAFETDTVSFREIADKEYFDETQTMCRTLIKESVALLDDTTQQNCIRLICIQVHYETLTEAQTILRQALNEGITSFSLFAEAPEEATKPTGCMGCLGVIAVGLVLLFAGASKGEAGAWAGMFMAFIIAVIYLLVDAPKRKKEKEEKEYHELKKARIDRYNSLRGAFLRLTHGIYASLELEESDLIKNLSHCVQIFSAVLKERRVLEDTYIRPYL